MQVQIHSDSHIEQSSGLSRRIEAEVEIAVARFGEQITRVEVHLSDTNGWKSGQTDKRCVMEARPAGLQPLAVSHQAPTLGEAVDGAAEKLQKSLERTFGRLSDRKGRVPFGGEETT